MPGYTFSGLDGLVPPSAAPQGLIALVLVGAVALLPFASTNIGLQASVSDDHAAAGHYGFLAAFALATIGLSALASLQPDGWRLTAWTAGLLAGLVGATSLAYPEATSSLALPWAFGAITWGGVFVAVAKRGPARRTVGRARHIGSQLPYYYGFVVYVPVPSENLMRLPISKLAMAVVTLSIGLVAAACGGDAGTRADGAGGPTDGVVRVTGTDGLAFEPAELTVPAGEVTIELTSEPSVPHTFTIEELGDVEVVRADAGQTASGMVDLEPGTYTFYCSIPGHREAGMEGTLTVQ